MIFALLERVLGLAYTSGEITEPEYEFGMRWIALNRITEMGS